MIREGSSVTYVGYDTHAGLAHGDVGRVLAYDYTTGTAHVLWSTGAKVHQSLPVYEDALIITGSLTDGLDDSLEVGTLGTFSARRTFDETGPTGLLNEMADWGHLAAFAEYAEEAVAHVSSRLRRDPAMLSAVAELDEDEAEQVFRTASVCLIRDAFTGSETDGV